MDSVEQISPQEWMVEPSAIKIMEILQSGEIEQKFALFVGGCVRNSLAKKPVNDLDIATLHKPDEVIKLLKEAGLKEQNALALNPKLNVEVYFFGFTFGALYVVMLSNKTLLVR